MSSVFLIVIVDSNLFLLSLHCIFQYIDFTELEMNTLLRYAALYKIEVPEDASKADLIGLVSSHAANYPHAREAEIISTFLYANERHRRDLEDSSKS